MIFNEIPQTRVPGQYAEFAISNLKGGLSALNYIILAIGQSTDAGSKAAKELVKVNSADQAGAFFGFGSMLHLQARAIFRNNNISELWAISASVDPLATPTNKATGTITMSGPATAAGSLYLYINGERIVIPVASGDVDSDIAAAINTELNSGNWDFLPVKSSVALAVVTLEAKNIGENGNDIDVRVNYNEGEVYPDGVSAAIVALTGGTATPTIDSGTPSVIDQLGDTWYQVIAFPYIDTTNWDALRDELDRRFGPLAQIDGVAITAKKDTQAALVTFGSGKNTKQICCLGLYDYPNQPLEAAAAAAGQVAQSLAAGNGSEARPFQTLELKGILPAPETSRFTFTERDSLLKNGIATLKADAAGVVRIERLITTFQLNESAAPDTTWLDANTRFIAMFIRWDWVNILLSKYPRAKLAGDSVNVGPGQVVITPKVAAAEAIARFALWEAAGLVEDFDFFKANLITERDPQDVNAMNWFLPCDFMNQFRVGKTQIGVIL